MQHVAEGQKRLATHFAVCQKTSDIQYLPHVSVTFPPAVQLSLQPLDGLLHWPVLLLFLLVLLLPLLCRELQVHGHSVSDGLGSKSRGENTEAGERKQEGRGGKQCAGKRYRKDEKTESMREHQRIELSTGVFQPWLLNENGPASH